MTTFRVSPDEKSVVVQPSVSSKKRLALVKDLQKAADEYVTKEKERLKNEVSVMQAILKGRSGGAGIQELNTQVAVAVAKKDMAEYLAPVT